MENKIDCSEIETMINYYKNKDENKKHLKGYMYDSLVYRYQLARYIQADYEALYRNKDLFKEKQCAERDIARFIQILDEAIGEHD